LGADYRLAGSYLSIHTWYTTNNFRIMDQTPRVVVPSPHLVRYSGADACL
jgi:hypothetical protein